MTQCRIFSVGPAFIASSVANMLNGAITSLTGPVGLTLTQPFLIIRRLRIINVTGTNRSFILYMGATGGSTAGTEILGGSKVVPANDHFEAVLARRMASTDFLTGVASAASALVWEADLEVGFS